MSHTLFDCADPAALLEGMRRARMAIGRAQVVCIPTDTGYALVADAFKPAAVDALRAARGMVPTAPVSVLVPGIPTLTALAENVPDEVQALIGEFWPGGLTLITPAGESLHWDLGNTRGTVTLRMPSNRVALELLSETGPLASSGAHRVGEAPGASAGEALEVLGDAVAVYLMADQDATGGGPSTVIDATGLDKPRGTLRVVREGAIPLDDIYEVVPASRFS